MRVTNKMLSDTFLSDMRTNLENLQTLQQQMSSGQMVSKPSDDPFASARIMQLNSDIDANKQYNENISDTSYWLQTTDTALNQVGNVLGRVKTLLTSIGNPGFSTQEMQAIKGEINEDIGQFSQILNTNFDGKYVFGGNRGTVKPTDTITDANGNTEIGYYNGTSGLINDVEINVTDADVAGGKWANKTINFSNGSSITTASSYTDVAHLVSDITSKISSDPNLNGKLSISKTSDGIQFTAVNSTDDIEIKNVKNSDNSDDTTTGLNNFVNKKIATQHEDNQMGMIGSKVSTEISEGVKIYYNINATDVLSFTNSKGNSCDLRTVLQNIVNHLDGKNDNGTAVDADATSKLIGQDLSDITDGMNNVLTVRADVGAMENRMESASTKNTEEMDNFTAILSKTQDVDVTKATMEYYSAQTVYLASLQTASKIIQPSLIDYLR